MKHFIHFLLYFWLLMTMLCSCTHPRNDKIPDVALENINTGTQIEYLNELAVKSPKDADIFYKLSRLYMQVEDIENAYTNIKRAVELEPKEAKYYFILVNCFLKKGLYLDAFDYFPKVSREEITEIEYVGLATDVYFYTGNYKNALRYLDQVIATDSNDAYLYWKRGYIYSTLKDTLQAIVNYERSIIIDSTFSDPLIGMAEYKNANGEYAEALKILNKALRFDTINKTLYFNLGWAFKGLENKEKAIYFYEKALKYDNNYTMALYNASVLCLQIKQFAKAEKYLKKVKSIKPDIENLDLKIAVALQAQGKGPEALNYFEKIDTSSINYNFAQLMIKKITRDIKDTAY